MAQLLSLFHKYLTNHTSQSARLASGTRRATLTNVFEITFEVKNVKPPAAGASWIKLRILAIGMVKKEILDTAPPQKKEKIFWISYTTHGYYFFIFLSKTGYLVTCARLSTPYSVFQPTLSSFIVRIDQSVTIHNVAASCRFQCGVSFIRILRLLAHTNDVNSVIWCYSSSHPTLSFSLFVCSRIWAVKAASH